MSEIESVSCIRFRPTANISEHHVAIHRNKTGCFADLGYQGKVQEMNLGIGCIHKGTIQHELLHSLGFVHMHCDPRRDDYVTIYWDNIEEKEKKQFVKIDPRLVTDFGVEYDYSSIMHYGAFTFSRNHQETIVPKLYGAKIGLQELSRLDKVKLNAAYCRSESPN
ncbi:zinc metalloproteinase nas-15-like [Drosophila busckii]|nr:zinc metalloproteinase nas-15-like [Drosophila busckii]